jgi:hypothetical protein
LGIVDAKYPQELTNINQRQKHKTLILQDFDQLYQMPQKAMIRTSNILVAGSNST